MMQLQLSSKKFGTNLGGRAFFFFGFTHRPIIETANSFVLNTLLCFSLRLTNCISDFSKFSGAMKHNGQR